MYMLLSKRNIFAQTHLSFKGYFLGFQTVYSSTSASLYAPVENITSQSCLKFYTFGNRDLNVVQLREGNFIHVSVPRINESTIWRPTQVLKKIKNTIG